MPRLNFLWIGLGMIFTLLSLCFADYRSALPDLKMEGFWSDTSVVEQMEPKGRPAASSEQISVENHYLSQAIEISNFYAEPVHDFQPN